MSTRASLLGLVAVCCLTLAAGAARADGCPRELCGTMGIQVPGSGLVLVRPSGRLGPLSAHDAATGAERFRIAAGLLSADGSRYVTVRHSVRMKGVRRDVVRLWDVARRAHVLRRYSFVRRVWPVWISADGYRIVLREQSRPHRSRFVIFDAAQARVLARVELGSAYEVEALSPDARRLYLFHWTRESYELRTFDLATRTVRPTRLADPDEKMTGQAMTAVATPDGRWLLTLYAGGAEPFVHALDLAAGVAHCIDLPWEGRDGNAVATAALALSPDRRKLYLANPALGHVTAVDLARRHVVQDVRFEALGRRAFSYGAWPAAAVTPRGRVLAFSGARLVWLFDTAYGVVRGPFAAGERVPVRTGVPVNVTALGFARDGHRLVALNSDRSRARFEAATGRRLDRRVPDELFAVRAWGARGLAGYGSTGGPRFVLPDGRASADGSSYVAAFPRRGNRTVIERYSPETGAFLGQHLIRGRWTLGAVSPSGRTIAIARHDNRRTWVRILDAATARTMDARTLRGVYTLEAVDDAGGRLFLIQHHRGGSYSVRAFDLERDRLWTATLREKGEQESPVMKGRSAGQVASTDGTWLLTLYLDTRKRAAFVHALNLRRAYAVCIDLPSRGSLRRLRDYSLTVAPGGVFAANGTVGVLARLDLRREKVTEVRRFPAAGRGGGWAAGALSRDGNALYFASDRNVWRYDASSRQVRGPVVAPGPVLGFAFSRDGRKVYAARADGGVATLDATRVELLAA